MTVTVVPPPALMFGEGLPTTLAVIFPVYVPSAVFGGTVIVTSQLLSTSVPFGLAPVAKVSAPGENATQPEGMGVPPVPAKATFAEKVPLFFGPVTISVKEATFPAGLVKDAGEGLEL